MVNNKDIISVKLVCKLSNEQLIELRNIAEDKISINLDNDALFNLCDQSKAKFKYPILSLDDASNILQGCLNSSLYNIHSFIISNYEEFKTLLIKYIQYEQ